jgi:lambda family phage portal protein
MRLRPMSFNAVDEFDKSIMLWKVDINQLENDLKSKEKIEARLYDLYRNNSLFRGMIEKQVDAVVGSRVSVQCLPEYEALGATREQAMAWQKIVEGEFHRYAYSPENWISSDRSMDLTQLIRVAYRSKLMTGEIFASREWRTSPIGYNTCFNVFSSHRVKSPKNSGKDEKVFHGIEFDEFGAAVAYHIEEAKPNQKRSFSNKQLKRVTKYSSFNWLQLFHLYEPLLPEYPRGISRAAASLIKIKQLDRYQEADLDKNIIAANYVMNITSDEDPESVADMLSGAGSVSRTSADFALDEAGALPPEIQAERDRVLKQISQRFVELHGGHIMHSFKGETVQILQPPVASQTSADYAKGYAKDIANGLGVSYALGTGDFQGLSFSGGQMDLGIYEHSANIERRLYPYKLVSLIFRAWLDEAMSRGTVPLLNDQPYFPNREAYSRNEATGAKRVHVDPLKIANSRSKDLASGTTSRTLIANENGTDLEAVIMDRANEAELYIDAIETVANARGIKMTDEAKLKIITDIVATNTVQTPEVVIEQPEV